MSTEFVKIITSDGAEVDLEKKFAEKSQLIMSALEDDPTAPVKVENVTKEIFDQILEFLTYYETSPYQPIPKPLRSNDLKENGLDEFYTKFAQGPDMTFAKLHDLFVASNYLNLKPCLDLCSAAVAAEFRKAQEKNGIQGIRDLLGIESGFTPEEEAMKRED